VGGEWVSDNQETEHTNNTT